MDLNLLRRLCCECGVSGDEKKVRDVILSQIDKHVDDLKVDNMGNILAFKKGERRAEKKIMLCAHMDEVGFMVTQVHDSVFLKFSPVGGINEDVCIGKSVVIGKDMLPGIIGAIPIHMSRDEEVRKDVSFDEMYIDIGAKDKDDVLSKVSLGDYVSFEPFFDVNSRGIIKAKAIDDRVGCFILIEMIKSSLPVDLHFAFVVQEEVGLRGAKVASYEIDPEMAFVVEATTASDICGVDEDKKVASLNSGPVISFMDRKTIYDRSLCELALSLAKDKNIKVQIKQMIAGGNDAGAISVSRSGVRTLAVSLPCRYLHSAVSVVSVEDIKSSQELLHQLILNA